MGGCRCSYKTCTSRSDGKTHMFHFPAFDKQRCHQWILNAQRYEYLNLVVSQVRNRLICQHHFKDDCFMNFKKDKLTYFAVPTEDGPYCSPEPENKINSEDVVNAHSLVVEDNDNNFNYIDKKTKSSIKYADFLSNSFLPVTFEDGTCWNSKNIALVPSNVNQKNEIVIDSQFDTFKTEEQCNINEFKNYSQNETNENQDTRNIPCTFNATVNDSGIKVHTMPNSNILQLSTMEPVNSSYLVTPVMLSAPYYNQCIETYNTNQSHTSIVPQISTTQNDSKVKILSETTISEPLSLVGKFEPVSPSLILRVPNRTKREMCSPPQKVELLPQKFDPPKMNIMYHEADVNTCEALTSKTISNVRTKIEFESDRNVNLENTEPKEDLDNETKIKEASATFKTLISPERVAAIEKKRRFNKKLRDIVESCLENTDAKKQTTTLKQNIEVTPTCNVPSILPKQEITKGSQDYTIAFLESRMKQMENILLRKIDQNSQRIVDLKKYVVPKKRVAVSTQTAASEETRKKYLYHEISKFLSPSANSLLYEELFINKYVANDDTPRLRKRKGK